MFLDSWKCFEFREVFWILGLKCFVVWEVFLILGSVLDPWKCLYREMCFAFLEGPLDSGKWFVLWEVFWILGIVL